MLSAIFESITIGISRVLEAVFDEIEYRQAKRSVHRAEAKQGKSTAKQFRVVKVS